MLTCIEILYFLYWVLNNRIFGLGFVLGVQKNSDSTNGITEENCTPGSHSETPFRKNFLTNSTFGSCTPKENGFQSIIAPRMKVKMWGVEVLYFVLEAAHLHEGLSSSIKIGPKKDIWCLKIPTHSHSISAGKSLPWSGQSISARQGWYLSVVHMQCCSLNNVM